MNGHPSILDRSALTALFELMGEDLDYLDTVIESYLTTSGPLLEQLSAALAAEDADALRLAAHTLKSGSIDMGANEFAECLRQMEMKGKSGELTGADDLMAEIGRLWPGVRDALEAVRGEVVARTFE